jgi:hypothetical protein
MAYLKPCFLFFPTFPADSPEDKKNRNFQDKYG